MAILTLTLTSAAVPSSPITRTVTFNDADLPNILAAFRAKFNNPAMTGGDVLALIAQQDASKIANITQQYLAQVSPPAPPQVTVI